MNPYPVVRAALCMFMLMMAACSLGSSEDEAIAIADQYYNAIGNQDWDRALTVLGGEDSPDVWRSKLQDTDRRLGHFQRRELKSVEVNTVYGGRLFILEYHTTYAHGRAEEFVTVSQGVTDPTLKIVAIKMDSLS